MSLRLKHWTGCQEVLALLPTCTSCDSKHKPLELSPLVSSSPEGKRPTHITGRLASLLGAVYKWLSRALG